MRFKRDTLERVNPKGPVPIRPEPLDIDEIKQKVVWPATSLGAPETGQDGYSGVNPALYSLSLT